MRKLFILLTCYFALFTSINLTEAHQPYESWLTNAETAYENAEKKCRATARRLDKLDTLQVHFKGEWDDNTEDIRDEIINTIGGVIQSDIVGALSSFFTSAINIGLDVGEHYSLSQILDTTISATRLAKVQLTKEIKDRNSKWDTFVYYIDSHNKRPGHPGTHKHVSGDDNIDKPDKEDFSASLSIHSWSFGCKGGCEMPMDSPISSHLTPCPSVGCTSSGQYHACNTKATNWHKERPCTRIIKVRREVYDETWGSTYFKYEKWKCTIKHRWCTKDDGPHSIRITLTAQTPGKYTKHYPAGDPMNKP